MRPFPCLAHSTNLNGSICVNHWSLLWINYVRRFRGLKFKGFVQTQTTVLYSSQSLKKRQCHGDLCQSRNLKKHLETLPSQHDLPSRQPIQLLPFNLKNLHTTHTWNFLTFPNLNLFTNLSWNNFWISLKICLDFLEPWDPP